MFNNFVIGKYFPVHSKLHQMNSISKILITMLFIIMLPFVNDLLTILILIILTLTMISLSNIPLEYYLKNLRSLQSLVIFYFLITLIFNQDLTIMIFSIIKMLLLITYTAILTFTTSPSEITWGLEKTFGFLKIFKVPVAQISLMLTLAIRFIPTLFSQANRVFKAAKSRGVTFDATSLKEKIMALKTVLIPMFILSLKRANDLSDAMEVRFYNFDVKRTNYRVNPWTNIDNSLVLIHLIILLVLIKEVIS